MFPFVKLKQHHCGFVGLCCPREEAARSNAAPQGHRAAARSCRSEATKRAALNAAARAGTTPRNRSRGAVRLIERTSHKERPTAPADAKPGKGKALAQRGRGHVTGWSRWVRSPQLSSLKDRGPPYGREGPGRDNARLRCALVAGWLPSFSSKRVTLRPSPLRLFGLPSGSQSPRLAPKLLYHCIEIDTSAGEAPACGRA
jgi:hypothetical protein